MTTYVVYPQGTDIVTVPASSSISVYTVGDTIATVSKLLEFSNIPYSWVDLGTVSNTETVYGPFTGATQVRISANADPVYYVVGVAPKVIIPSTTVTAQTQGTPNAQTVAATLTIANLLTKIITGTHAAGATQAYTLPTGTLVDAAVQLPVNGSFDWCLINLSAAALDTITLTAGTDHTIVGNPIIQSAHVTTGGITGNSAQFRTRKTATNTYVTYRIA